MKQSTLIKRLESLLNNLRIHNQYLIKINKEPLDTKQLEQLIKSLKEEQ